MRTLKHLFVVFAATTLLFLSCKTDPTADLAVNIPDSAIFVVKFNAKQIIEKGGLNKFKDFNLYGIIRKEINSENEKLAQMFDEFITDTRTSGLNLDRPYMYAVKSERSFNVVFLFKIDNVQTFEAKLKELMQDSSEEPVNKKGFKQLKMDYNTDMVWDKDILYIVTGNYSWDDEETTDYGYLFAENKKNITTNTDFAEFTKKSCDVGFWLSYDQILKMADDFGAAFSLKDMMIVDINGMYVHALLNFNDGEAKITAAITPKSKMDEMWKQYSVLKTDFDTDLLKYLPEQSFSVMKLSFNVQEYTRMLKDQLAKINNVVKDEQEGEDDEDTYYHYDPMAEITQFTENETFKTISSGLGGDFIVSLYDFQQGLIPMPMASLIFNVKNKETYDAIIGLIPSDMLKQQNNYYSLMAGPMAVAHVAFKDNKVYATTDEKAITAFLDKGFDKNIGNSALAKNLKSDLFYWNINVDLASYPSHITMLLRNTIGREYNIFTSFINIYKSIEYRVTADREFEFVVKMQSNNNSLKTILKNLDENIPTLMGN